LIWLHPIHIGACFILRLSLRELVGAFRNLSLEQFPGMGLNFLHSSHDLGRIFLGTQQSAVNQPDGIL
jgi:hypothetical protein